MTPQKASTSGTTAGDSAEAVREGPERPITVLHVIAHIEKAGAERQLALLVGSSQHHHVIAVLAGNAAPSPAIVETLSSLSPASIFRDTRALIAKHKVDIVQLWLPDRITIPAMFAALLSGCRIISGDRRRVRNYGPGAIRDRLPYINHAFADLIIPNYPHIVPTISLRKILRLSGRTRTILNGIEQSPVRRSMAAAPTRLLFVGRFVEQKRVGELIDLMPKLLATAGVTGLDIVGEGDLESDYRARIARHGIGEAVTFHGRLSDWGWRFSPDENVLILPSTSEGMSNTLFEAIAYGFLPLASRSPELEAILAGWPEKPELFDPWDASTIEAAVKRALAEPVDRQQTRIRAMQDQLEQFSIARMADAYDAAYAELMRRRGS